MDMDLGSGDILNGYGSEDILGLGIFEGFKSDSGCV